MLTKSKKVAFCLLWVILSTAIAVVAAELLIRKIKPAYDYTDRAMLLSSPTFRGYSSGAVRYLPHETIREVVVCNRKIEYDVRYGTNNLGFVDTKDYGYEFLPGKSYYALVGDSFTAGVHGGTPWIPELRNKLHDPQVEIYNLGVEGTNFEHFRLLLHDVRKDLSITHIVLIAISDDLTRSWWHPFVDGNGINFCFQVGKNYDDIFAAGIIPESSTKGDILRISDRIMKVRTDKRRAREGFTNYWLSESHLLYYLRKLANPHLNDVDPGYVNSVAETLYEIREEFPSVPIDLIHLPEKNEVAARRYRVSGLGEEAEALGIRYFPALQQCTWTTDMFYPNDMHPNAKGYENISKCVSTYLFGR